MAGLLRPLQASHLAGAGAHPLPRSRSPAHSNPLRPPPNHNPHRPRRVGIRLGCPRREETVMNEVPARASAVVIGAGIVGNSLVHHLDLLGWRDVVLVDKGPLPNPGGSTGHASNFIF